LALVETPRLLFQILFNRKDGPAAKFSLKIAAYLSPILKVPPKLEAPPCSSTPISDPLYSVCPYDTNEAKIKKVEYIYFIVE
jgi:hypothetical protein